MHQLSQNSAAALDVASYVSSIVAAHLPLVLTLAFLLLPPVRRVLLRAVYRQLGLKHRWKELLKKKVPVYERLPGSLKKRLEISANIFLREVRFKGKEGFRITESEKVLVAGNACILLLGWRMRAFNGVRRVLIYPSALPDDSSGGLSWFKPRLPRIINGLWRSDGTIRLNWNAAKYGAENPFDGQNVVFHEFAHELDYLYDFSGGLCSQEVGGLGVLRTWLFRRELRKLRREEQRQDAVIREYGTTNQAELFATATEAFFERPHDLKTKHPAIYKRLQKIYCLDPASW